MVAPVFIGNASANENVPEAREEIDPRAVEIALKAAEFLSEQPRIAFGWFNSYDLVVDGRQKITYSLSGSSLLSRKQGFHSAFVNDGQSREFYFDGAEFVFHDVDDNAYSQLPFAGTFEELTERLRIEYGLTMPMWEILNRRSSDEFLEGVTAALYLGETTIGNEPVHHLAFSEYTHDWQIWISTDPDYPLIHSIVGTESHAQGWPQYRAYMYDWDFETIPELDAFSFVPPEGAIEQPHLTGPV